MRTSAVTPPVTAESQRAPAAVEKLADELMASDGVEAVVVGGSRAIGRTTDRSDWDIGVYYRAEIDLSALRRRGEVHAPGSWGRLMNGGAWLEVEGLALDVLLRDLDAVEHWTTEAGAGRFAMDGLPGYVAGIPTYSLAAEASVAVLLRGDLQRPKEFPDALVDAGATKWRLNRDFSLYHASMHARRGNAVPVAGQLARAVLEEAHARACASRRWVLNEKHLLDAVEMSAWTASFFPLRPQDLPEWVADTGERLASGR